MLYFCFCLKFLYVNNFFEKCKNGFVLILQLKKGGGLKREGVLYAGFYGNLSSSNLWLREGKGFIVLGLENFRLYCTEWLISQKVQICDEGHQSD